MSQRKEHIYETFQRTNYAIRPDSGIKQGTYFKPTAGIIQNHVIQHRRETIHDSGASVINLSNIVYISLDTFHNTVHNISTELDAWLTFLSSDSPTDMIELVAAFPKFREYYQDIVNFRKHPKKLIHMYSEALLAVDRNTVQYMVDELKNELEAYQNELEGTKNELQASKDELQASKNELQASKEEISHLKSLLKQYNIPTDEQ